MIKAGNSFCPYCVRVHKKAFYGSENLGWGVWLNRKKIGGKYEVQAEDFKRNEAPKGKVSLLSLEEKTDGLPNAIQIGYSDSGNGQEVIREKRLVRSCPVCAEKYIKFRPVNWVMGKYPTFVVAMIGDKSAGKSAWLDSIATFGNMDAVNTEGYVHSLSYTTPAVNDKRSKATDPSSRGQTKVLLIHDTQDHNQVVAAVCLVDVAGELYNATVENEQIDSDKPDGILVKTESTKLDRSKKDVIWDLLDRNIDYPGADGYVFVAPAVNNHKNPHEQYPADQIYKDLASKNLLTDKPLAYVMTHLDKLIENGEFQTITSFCDEKEYPGMTADTFDMGRRTSYARKDLLARVALEHAAVRAYEPAVLANMNGPTKCFMVRSCALREEPVTIKDPNTGEEITEMAEMEDFRASRNVMDPLLWMLNQLKLFPLRERAE